MATPPRGETHWRSPSVLCLSVEGKKTIIRELLKTKAIAFLEARISFAIELREIAVFDLDGAHPCAAFRSAHLRLCSSALAMFARYRVSHSRRTGLFAISSNCRSRSSGE
jgi:hypothetical protein